MVEYLLGRQVPVNAARVLEDLWRFAQCARLYRSLGYSLHLSTGNELHGAHHQLCSQCHETVVQFASSLIVANGKLFLQDDVACVYLLLEKEGGRRLFPSLH
jgi:hypothetical protein